MKNWEEIIKDKLEAQETALPESVFEEFRARRDAAGTAGAGNAAGTAAAGESASAGGSARKWLPLVWALVPAAVAAGLAAVLFLRRPDSPESGVQVVAQPVLPVADAVLPVADSVHPVAEAVEDEAVAAEDACAEPVVAGPDGADAVVTRSTTKRRMNAVPGTLVAQAANLQQSQQPQQPQQPQQSHESQHLQQPEPAETSTTPATPTAPPETHTTSASPTTPAPAAETASPSSPFLPEGAAAARRPVSMKTGLAVGAVAGGGLLAAAATALGSGLFGSMDVATPVGPSPETLPPSSASDPSITVDEFPSGHRSHFPFRAGLSIGIPIAERLKLTTGLEYSLYVTTYTYSLQGDKNQLAHYLGIPLRLDWTLASNKWLDAYLGGGIEGDCCIGATFDGRRRIRREGLAFSLLGAGGVQFNFTDRTGLFLEPRLSWTIPSDNHELETWRTDNPLMFSVAAGIRFNLGNK